MPITSAICNSFLLAQGIGSVPHNFHLTGGHVFKLALIKAVPTGTYDKATTSYTQLTTDEVTGTGYTAGGATLTRVTPVLSGDIVVYDFSDASWPLAVGISASGALLYNDTLSGKPAIRVQNFGSVIVAHPVDGFSAPMPPATATTAILRLRAG